MGKHKPRLPVPKLGVPPEIAAVRKKLRVVVKGIKRGNETKGEDRHNTKLTDHEVELMRDLHERDAWGLRRLARAFDISRTHVKRLVRYKLR